MVILVPACFDWYWFVPGIVVGAIATVAVWSIISIRKWK